MVTKFSLARAMSMVGASGLILVLAGQAAGQAGGLGGGPGGGSAATPAIAAPRSVEAVSDPVPQRATLRRLQRPVTVNFSEQRLEEVVKFLQAVTQAEIDPKWSSDNSSGVGLDKDKLITLKVKNRPALNVIEAVLEKARTDGGSGNAWQLDSEGALEIGPKEILNKSRRLVIYDIHDLILVIPNHTDVPAIDLSGVLQQGSGGQGTNPFTGNNAAPAKTPEAAERERKERIRQITDILQQNVEPEQWADNGGDGATIREWNSTLIVNAPDYIHRQINGYPYWPSSVTSAKGGRRYVSLNMDTGISTVDGFAQQPVTGVVPGNPGGGGGGGGGAPGRTP